MGWRKAAAIALAVFMLSTSAAALGFPVRGDSGDADGSADVLGDPMDPPYSVSMSLAADRAPATHEVTFVCDPEKGTCDTQTITLNHLERYTDLPEVTAKPGYKFVGWVVGFLFVNEIYCISDMTLTAAFTKESGRSVLTFDVDAEKSSDTPEPQTYRETGIVMRLPEIVPNYGYRFVGWTYEGKAVSAPFFIRQDMTLSAEFEETVPHHEVTFVAGSETVYRTKVADGTSLPENAIPAVPEKERTQQYTYTGRWSGDLTAAITADTVFEAVYDETVNKYTVSFFAERGDREPFAYHFADYGTPISLPSSVPSKEGKVFLEWGGFVPGPITEDAAYYAVFADGSVTENADGSVTTVIEDGDTTTTTNYATDGTSTVKEETTEQIHIGGGISEQKVTTEIRKDANGKMESSRISIISNDRPVSTSATIKEGRSAAETTIKSQTDESGNVSIADSDIDAALSQLERVDAEAGTEVSKTVVVNASGGADDSSSASISAQSLKSIGDRNARLSLKSDVGTIEIGGDIAGRLTSDAAADARVRMSISNIDTDELSDRQQRIVGDRTVISLSAAVGQSSVHELGGKAKITIPYELKEGESADDVTVFYIDGDGECNMMETAYDSANGTVTFVTDHFSYYFVAESPELRIGHVSEIESNPLYLTIAGIIGIAIISAAAFMIMRRC